MTDVAFIGTGLMGAPMAERLLRAGHRLTVWNRTASKTRNLAAMGATVADSPSEAAAGAGAVVTMLADPPALDQVAFGAGGFAQALAPGSLFIEMSTIGPDHLLSVAGRLPAGVRVVDAPVLGSVPQAIEGSLEIFAGGEEADVAAAMPILTVLGNTTRIGPPGSGAALKLVVNSALVSLQCLLGECLALGDSFDISQAIVLDALSASSLGPVVAKKRDNVETGVFTPRFTLANGIKDAALVEQAARSREVPLRLAPAAHSWYADALAGGLGGEDYSAVVKTIRARR